MENLKKEFQMFKILLLKNFSSQKHFRNFQKLFKVKKVIIKLIGIDAEHKLVGGNVAESMLKLMELFKVCSCLKETVSDAYSATRVQTQNAWFLPLNLTFMAILARFYCIADILLDEQCTDYEHGYRKLDISNAQRFPFKIDGEFREIEIEQVSKIQPLEEKEFDCEEDIKIDIPISSNSNLSDEFFNQPISKVPSKASKKKRKKINSPEDEIDSIFDNL